MAANSLRCNMHRKLVLKFSFAGKQKWIWVKNSTENMLITFRAINVFSEIIIRQNTKVTLKFYDLELAYCFIRSDAKEAEGIQKVERVKGDWSQQVYRELIEK